MNKYLSKKYLHIPRMQAYIEQYRYVEDGDNILEIGNAGGIFQAMVSKIADYKSVDIDKKSNPDFFFDLSTINDEEKDKIGKFNKVFCCEVLEHIPFESLKISLKNLFDFSKDLVIISVPDNRYYFRFYLGLSILFKEKTISFPITIPFTGKLINKNNHKEHYWEIFWENYKLIVNIFNSISKENGSNLIKNYRFFSRPYQHFFIFKKIK